MRLGKLGIANVGLAVLICCLSSWVGCARPDLAGRLEAAPDDVAKLQNRLQELDW